MIKLEFFDLEVYPNLFVAVFLNKETNEYKVFIKWDSGENDCIIDDQSFKIEIGIDEIPEMIQFLKDNKNTYFIGYNSLNYDLQILNFIIENPECTTAQIKEFNDKLINSEWAIYREKELYNKTIDLMLVNNYGIRSAKSTSLKALEFNMRKKKIEDLPYHFNDFITKKNQVEDIIKYCKYDVETTKDVLEFSKDLVKMRWDLGKLENLNLINSPDPDIARKYMMKHLSNKLDISEYDLKKMKTYRKQIIVKDLILPYIKFDNKEFKDVLDFYNSLIIEASIKSNIDPNMKIISLKNKIEYKFELLGGEFVFGAGGVHFANKPGVYEADDEYIIIDSDVAALYPSLAILNRFYPAHLGEHYCDTLNENVQRRKKYSKKEFPSINNGIKVVNNSTYGMSNSEYSPFYDPEYTLKTCVAGMLSLSMVVDKCISKIKDFTLIQLNTK
jgi:hypothetical protein